MKTQTNKNAYSKRVTCVLLALTLAFACLPIECLKSIQVSANENPKEIITSSGVKVTYPTKEEQDEITTVSGRERSQEEIEEAMQEGGAISFVDHSTEDISPIASSEGSDFDVDADTTLPEKVDLRDRGTVGAVRYQDPWGTCWAQSANGAAEINIAKQTGNSPLKLAPMHTSWFAYTALPTSSSELTGSQKTQAGEGAWENTTTSPKNAKLDLGGGLTTAPSTFMQGSGIALDSDFQYDCYVKYVAWVDKTRDNFEEKGGYDYTKRFYSLARLKKWSYLGSARSGGSDVSYGTNMTVINRMKAAINNGDGVDIAYRSTTELPEYMNSSTMSQYIDTTMSHNHAVVVVGYDDNWSADNFNSDHKPPANGAFIVKNSHGSSWGKSGYFYLSYYDKSLDEASVYDFDLDGYNGSYINNNTEVIDQYDFLRAHTMASMSGVEWYSNVYTTYQKQKLHHIGTYYCNPGTTMQYKVYRLKSDAVSPSDVAYSLDSPEAEGTYYSDCQGFVSIKLDTPISLAKGEKYAIWFSGSAPRANVFSSSTVTEKVVINSNESFYKSNYSDSWSALAATSGTGSKDNFCVKGYATVQGSTSTVTFNANGGTSVSSQTVSDGGKVTSISTPTKSGFTFGGWYYDKNFTTAFSANDAITHDVTLYAKWTAKINYVLNGGTNSANNPKEYVSGVAVELENASKKDYDFAGWWTSDGTGGNWGSQVKKISADDSGDKTLYARWALHAFSITYTDSKGGTNPNPTSYTTETGKIDLLPAVKEGYDFIDWYSDDTGLPVKSIAAGTTGDIKLTAKWNLHYYSINYENAEGATNPNSTSYTIEIKNDIKLSDASRGGYTFAGWWTKDGRSDGAWGEKVEKIQKGSFGDRTFYAKWITGELTITYENVSGATNPNPSYFSPDETLKLKDATKAGYDFVGWTDAGGNKITEIAKGTTESVKLTANWKPHNYAINYKNCSGANNPNPLTYTCVTDSFQLLEPTRLGYVFERWTDASGKEVVYVYSGTTGDLTFTANWQPLTYTIQYQNLNGATNPNTISEYTPDTATITLKNPTREGYVFDGWYSKLGQTTGDWGKKITKIDKGSVGNITLYAKWSDELGSKTMHRLYNKWTGEHFYTSDTAERDNLVKIGWNNEGEGWTAPEKSSQPVYRLYNNYVLGGDHHYTMDENERDSLVKAGWQDEGIGWYSDENKGVPLYRQYNPFATVGTHNYTTSKSENDTLVLAGWRAEGISWYGVK